METYSKVKKMLLFLGLWMSVYSADGQIAAVDLSKGADKASVEDIVIVFKMHFDIGYTDWAESILQRYTTSMLDETMSSIERTGVLPAQEQFVWTLPGWPMKYILENSTPSRRVAVEQALRNGRLTPHALPITYETESSDLETLVRGMSFTSDINRKYGQPLSRSAKLTDVPSHSWVLPTLLTNAGVDILHIGCNPGSISPDVPTLFWWEGADGSRLLTFNWAEYYGSGVMPPKGWRHKTWLAMIHTHENTGAPSPEEVAAVLKEAREKAPNARVKIGKMEDFYDLLMKESPDLPVIKGDMPDTWIHGYMSMPREVKINKSVQRLIYNAETLNALLPQWGIESSDIASYVDQAIEQSILFDEHTFGLALSHGNQGRWSYGEEFSLKRAHGEYDFIEGSWYEKGNRVHKAHQLILPSLRKDLKRLAEGVNVEGRRVVVYNPLAWERSGVVSFHMGIYQKDFKVTGLKDESTGEILPVENDYNLLTFFAKEIPSLGYKTYTVLTDKRPEVSVNLRKDEAGRVIENSYFKLTLSGENGALISVWDKKRGREMVDANSQYGFGEYLNEKFGKEDIDRYNASYVKPGAHNWADDEMGRPDNAQLHHSMQRGATYKTTCNLTDVSVSATSFCRMASGEEYTITYTLFEESPYIELCWGMSNKKADPQPEAGWIAFPFKVSKPTFHLGRTGAVVSPSDFVKNSNHDYFFLNTGMAVVDKSGSGFGLNTPNAPGVSLDRPGLFRFSREFEPQQPNVFVNLYNTQWGTNFTEWIEGGISAKIYLWSVDDYANEESLITPVEQTRVPLMAVYAHGERGEAPLSAQGIALSRKGVLVTGFGQQMDGGVLLRLWEQAGKGGVCTINLKNDKYKSAWLCNLRGETFGEPIAIKNGVFSVNVDSYKPVSLILK